MLRYVWFMVMGVMLVAMLGVVTGCDRQPGSGPQTQANDNRPLVVATTTMIADLAQRLGGEQVRVVGLMKPGEDPHVYDVRPRDAQTIAQAKLVLLNGLHLESTLLHIIENNAKDAKVIALAEEPRIVTLGSTDKEGAPDPHCWFDVNFYKVYVERARDGFMAIDPNNAALYQQRAKQYLTELTELDAWVRSEIETIPAAQRIIITSHDAFAYLGKAYGIEVHAVVGISTEQAPKPQDVQRLETMVKEKNIAALFIETSVTQTLNDMVRKVAENTGARIGGTLYSDSLGPADSPAGTYIGMVRHNVQTITAALK